MVRGGVGALRMGGRVGDGYHKIVEYQPRISRELRRTKLCNLARSIPRGRISRVHMFHGCLMSPRL